MMEFVVGASSCEAGKIVYEKWYFDLHVQCCGSCMVSTEFWT